MITGQNWRWLCHTTVIYVCIFIYFFVLKTEVHHLNVNTLSKNLIWTQFVLTLGQKTSPLPKWLSLRTNVWVYNSGGIDLLVFSRSDPLRHFSHEMVLHFVTEVISSMTGTRQYSSTFWLFNCLTEWHILIFVTPKGLAKS